MIRTLWRGLLLALLLIPFTAAAQYVTIQGTLQASNGLPAVNYTIAFTPTQWFYVAGTGVTVNLTTYCGTSIDGSVVGITNPLQDTINTPSYGSGTLPAGNYYSVYTWYTATATETLVSPETTAQMTSTGTLQIAPPPGPLPAGVVGMKVYIGLTSGSETYQGSTVGTSVFNQAAPIVNGSLEPGANTTVCKEIANDAGWPTGTGYVVSLTDPSGNTLPGYPMTWQILGPNSTINLSNGLPYYHGVVTYPVPILASPQNHGAQSISGPLSLTGYNLVNVGALGVGTGLPAWGVDVEGSGLNGFINAKSGYLVNGAAGSSGNCLLSDGTAYDTAGNCFMGTPFYQAVLNGATAGTAVTQRENLAVGHYTGILAVDQPPVGSRLGRTELDLDVVGGPSTLSTDPYAVVTAAGGANGDVAVWDGTLGGIGDGGPLPLGTSSAVTNGYLIIPASPHNIIIEWGDVAALNDDAQTTATLPLAFPNGCFSATASENETNTAARPGNPRTIAAACSTTQILLWANGSGSEAQWHAIGW
ncbi:MAG: hypothetical protein WB608_16230 [Terracidiphilus sp.]